MCDVEVEGSTVTSVKFCGMDEWMGTKGFEGVDHKSSKPKYPSTRPVHQTLNSSTVVRST